MSIRYSRLQSRRAHGSAPLLLSSFSPIDIMRRSLFHLRLTGQVALATAICTAISSAQNSAPLPNGVKAVWDLSSAYREQTPTRERVCLNGLWRWQPATQNSAAVPAGGW